MVYIIFSTLQYQRANLRKTAEIINVYHKNNVKASIRPLQHPSCVAGSKHPRHPVGQDTSYSCVKNRRSDAITKSRS